MSDVSSRGKLLKLFALMDADLTRLATCKMVHIFTQICILNDEHKGVNQANLMRLMGMFSSTLSRNLQVLGSRHRNGEGLGLIKLETDPKDSRGKVIFLTPRGRRLWEQMLATIQ
jgi:DNA-binding MarR family transcriptional regulator